MYLIFLILVCSIGFGITMKIADLLDEHGLKMFFGADIFFGVIWGVLGVILMYSNNSLANSLLAMVIAFIIRRRIDYVNHVISVVLIVLGFILFKLRFDLGIFSFFFISFLIFGSIKDFRYIKSLNKLKEVAVKINNVPYIYGIPGLIFAIITGQWIVFFVLFMYETSYILTTNVFEWKDYK